MHNKQRADSGVVTHRLSGESDYPVRPFWVEIVQMVRSYQGYPPTLYYLPPLQCCLHVTRPTVRPPVGDMEYARPAGGPHPLMSMAHSYTRKTQYTTHKVS